MTIPDPLHQFEVFGTILRRVAEGRDGEANFGALTRALEESIILARTFEGTVDYWTSGCEKLYGWTAEQAIGKCGHELLQTRFPAPLQQIERELVLSGSWKGELEQSRRNGNRVFVSTYWVLLTDAVNAPLGVIEISSDITARIEVQQELQSANQRLKSMAAELERSNEELEEFARIASHDLSAPITSTRWLVEILSSRYGQLLDESGRSYLEKALQSLDRMGELVEGILAHARVGTRPLSTLECTHAEDALVIAIDNLRKHIIESDARVEYSSLPEVAIEPLALTQLFQNLISNAIKYARLEVSPVIRIFAQQEDGAWRFCVDDNGIGIEPEWLERVFQPMQRRPGLAVKGSGIGLATCNKIVSRAGGKIWVESTLGSGSKFFFTLPDRRGRAQACSAAVP